MNQSKMKLAVASVLGAGALLAAAGSAQAATEFKVEVSETQALDTGPQTAGLNAISPLSGFTVGFARFWNDPDVQPTSGTFFRLGSTDGKDPFGKKHTGAALDVSFPGETVGYYQSTVDGIRLRRPYDWGRGTTAPDLGIFPGQNVELRSVDDNGNTVGVAYVDDGPRTAFLHSPHGNLVILPAVTGGKTAEANDINGNGLVVGKSDGVATSWPKGVATKLGTLAGATEGEALHSNFGGTAVGDVTMADGAHRAVVFSGGEATDLNFPTSGSGADVRANSINDSGTVVGTGDVAGRTTAVIYRGGTVTDLNSLIPAGSGLTLLTAKDIDNDGNIVGVARLDSDPNGTVGYELRPIG
jgi:hypothetical protein